MGFLLALSFLTRIPLPARIRQELGAASGPDLAAASSWFPLVGLVVGAFAALGYSLALTWFSRLPATVLAVLVVLAVTGAFHLDGLADTVDGLCCGGDRERAFAAMRDPRVGAAGAAAIVLTLLLKVGLLVDVSAANAVPALLLAPVAGRWSLVLAMPLFPSARQGEGLGAVFARAVGGRRVGAATLLFVAVIFAVGRAAYFPYALAGAAAGLLLARYLTRRLGGLTGDTYGAINEVVETVFLAFIASR